MILRQRHRRFFVHWNQSISINVQRMLMSASCMRESGVLTLAWAIECWSSTIVWISLIHQTYPVRELRSSFHLISQWRFPAGRGVDGTLLRRHADGSDERARVQVQHNVPFERRKTESRPKSSLEPLGYTVCMQNSGDVVSNNSHDQLDSSLVIQDWPKPGSAHRDGYTPGDSNCCCFFNWLKLKPAAVACHMKQGLVAFQSCNHIFLT